jgi:hypothetical protein
MLIRVIYHDGHTGLVDDSLLGELISQGRILQFRRADGWVLLGYDQVRLSGSDRRRPGRLLNIYI